jgi:hypothetical protein
MNTYKQFPIIVHCLKYYVSIIDKYIDNLLCDKDCIIKREKELTNSKIFNKQNVTNVDTSSVSSTNVSNGPKHTYATKALEKKQILSSNTFTELQTNISSVTWTSSVPQPPRMQLPALPALPALPVLISKKEVKEVEEIKEIKEIHDRASLSQETSDLEISPFNNDNVDIKTLYSDTLLDELDKKWTDSKINILIDMIKYLLSEESPTDYANCIETFMVKIDKETSSALLLL